MCSVYARIYFTIQYTGCWCELWSHILPVLCFTYWRKAAASTVLTLAVCSFHNMKLPNREAFYRAAVLSVPQEDISKLRRKIEKAKKPAEKISNGDDILNEEINEYKVCLLLQEHIKHFTVSLMLLQGHNCV